MHNPGTFDWSDLRYFLAVAREGSTLAAAKLLRVNQSTVQRRLSELERDLGWQLVERHPTGYRLTGLGKELLPLADRVEDAANALQRHAATFDKELKGSVRLTCSTAVAYRLTRSGLLEAFRKRHPAIEVELLMTERLLNLSKGDADIAIRGGQAGEERLIGKRIADVSWGVYASRAYVARHGMPAKPEEINDHNMIEFIGEIADLPAARWLLSRAPRAHVSGQASNIPSVLLAVRSGGGVALLPSPLADLDDDLVRVIGPIPELKYPVFLLIHRDLRKVPRMAAVFDFFVRKLRPVITGA